MFHATRLHHDVLTNDPQYTLRIGAKVPPNAVNLAYFHNNFSKLADHLLIAEAPKQTIEHLKAQQIVERTGLSSNSDKWFEQYLLYQNEQGYMGYLTRDSIHWVSTQTQLEKMVEHQISKETETEEVEDVYYYQDHQYKGNLVLKEATYLPTRYQETIESKTYYRQEQRKMYQKDLLTPNYEWPTRYRPENGNEQIEIEGYKGTLYQTGQARYYKQTTPVPGEGVTFQKTTLNVSELPQTLIQDGIRYQLVSMEEKTENLKYFGIVRWSGSFLTVKDVNGLYGTAHPRTSQYYYENVFVRNTAGTNIYGRGHFTEVYPKIPAYIWNAVQFDPYATQVTDFALQMPNKTTLTYDKKVDSRLWMMDTTHSPTGLVWADEWNKNQPFPPVGYEPIGNPTIELNTTETPHYNKLNVGAFNNSNRLTAYYAPTASGNRVGMTGTDLWFRDAIVFYKTKAQVFTGYYVGHKPLSYQHTWHGEQRYAGTLEKIETTVKTTPTAYLCQATYLGKVMRDIQTYNGTAYYSGLITKQDGLSATPSQLQRTFEMYANEGTSILETASGQSQLESRRFLMTNHYKELEPLYYVYRLKYPVVMTSTYHAFQYYQGKSIQLLDGQLKPLPSRMKYNIELKLVEEAGTQPLYWVYVYTNFLTTSQNTVQCMYNAYDLQSKGIERIRTGHLEWLNTQPLFIPNQNYQVQERPGEPKSYQIKVSESRVLEDNRNKIPFQFIVSTTDGSYQSTPMNATALNRNFSFYRERSLFNGRYYNVSPLKQSRYLTAQDILIQYSSEGVGPTAQDLAGKQICVSFNLDESLTAIHSPKLSLYTKPDGSDYIWVETTEQTGFYNEKTDVYDRQIELEGIYHVTNHRIQMAYQVVCLDTQSIKVLDTRATEVLAPWFPRIQYGRFSHMTDLNGVKTKLTYAIPEFDHQLYSSEYGRPYIEIEQEVAKIVDENTIQVQFTPMFVKLDPYWDPTNLHVYKIDVKGVKQSYDLSHWSYTEGYITLQKRISENDKIYVDYVYEESTYTYRGYLEEQGLVDLDLNPNQYHTFTDTRQTPWVERQVHELFNSIVYFFVKPMILQPYSFDGQPVLNRYTVNEAVVYHQIDHKTPQHPETDLLIGSVYVRHNTSLHSTSLIDTRQSGGGLIEEMRDQLRLQLEPASQHYFDIGYWDGEPFSENAVIIIRLDKRLLAEHGGQFKQAEIDEIISKWTAFGVLPLVEYVTSLDEITMPQGYLTVTSEEVEEAE